MDNHTPHTREQRRYSDEEQASALAALAANGGNLYRTAEETGIPRNTLRSWMDGTVKPPPDKTRQAKRLALRNGIEKLAARTLKRCLKTAADPEEKVSLRDGAVVLGICVDKLQALDNASTAPQPEQDARLALFRQHFGAATVVANELHIHLAPVQAEAPPAPINVTESATTAENAGNPG